MNSQENITVEQFAKEVNLTQENLVSLRSEWNEKMNSFNQSVELLQQSIKGLQKQRTMNGGVDNRTSNNRFSKIPRFSGEDVEGWLYKCEHFFNIDETPINRKIRYAMLHLDGRALSWHFGYIKSSGKTVDQLTWDEYSRSITARFSDHSKSDANSDAKLDYAQDSVLCDERGSSVSTDPKTDVGLINNSLNDSRIGGYMNQKQENDGKKKRNKGSEKPIKGCSMKCVNEKKGNERLYNMTERADRNEKKWWMQDLKVYPRFKMKNWKFEVVDVTDSNMKGFKEASAAVNRIVIIVLDALRYTKMGFAGNVEPFFNVPTVVTVNDSFVSQPARSSVKGSSSWLAQHSAGVMADLDFYIGEEAMSKSRTSGIYNLTYPIKHGQVENWDAMERFWQQCIYNYLQCDPEDHYFLLTESRIKNNENLGTKASRIKKSRSRNKRIKRSQRAKPVIVDPGLYMTKKSDVFWITQRRSVPTAFKLFTGSTWMVLSRPFIDFCIWGWDNLPRTVLVYYANFISSPEGYFHTVVCKAQDFRNRTVNSDLHFISWDNPPTQHPHYLTIDHMQKMIDSNALFARKFHQDDPVLDRINSELFFRSPGMIVPGGWCIGSSENGSDPCSVGGNITLLKPTIWRIFSKNDVEEFSPDPYILYSMCHELLALDLLWFAD